MTENLYLVHKNLACSQYCAAPIKQSTNTDEKGNLIFFPL